MNAIVIGPPKVNLEPGGPVLSAEFTLEDKQETMWFRFPLGFPLFETADPFVLSLRMTALKLGLPLCSKAPVSKRLLQSIPLADKMFHAWYPELTITPIEAKAATHPEYRDRETASFFSGGLDAFYTAVKNLDRLSMLVLIHGFDFKRSNHEYRAKVSAAAGDAARMLGKRLIEVETNSRDFTEPHVAWGAHQHGIALAAVAAAMGNAIDRMLIPATATYRRLSPCGSHPMTDPLWSTDLVSIEHDGIEASRTQKAVRLSNHAAAMKYLRVCWRNPDNAYNCGRCEKCVRTMISLLIAGTLDDCSSFPTKLTPELIDQVTLPSEISRYLIRNNYEELKAGGGHPDLLDALERLLHRETCQALATQLAAMSPLPENLAPLSNAVIQHRESLLAMMASKHPARLLADTVRIILRKRGHPGS